MLNPFPELLNWSYFAPSALRVVLALYFITLAVTTYRRGHKKAGERNYSVLAILELFVGSFLLVGFYTQVAGAVATGFGIVGFFLRYKRSHEAPESLWFYFLASTVALSLVVLGSGAFAFDIPL